MTYRLSAEDIVMRKLVFQQHAPNVPSELMAKIHGARDRLPDFHFFEQPDAFKRAHDAWFDLPPEDRASLLEPAASPKQKERTA